MFQSSILIVYSLSFLNKTWQFKFPKDFYSIEKILFGFLQEQKNKFN